jgi:hypothetical protein
MLCKQTFFRENGVCQEQGGKVKKSGILGETHAPPCAKKNTSKMTKPFVIVTSLLSQKAEKI